MRKFIATACAFTILGLTTALANANSISTGSGNSTLDPATQALLRQQPGSAADKSADGQPQAGATPDPYQDPSKTGNVGASKDQSAGTTADEQTTTTRTETKWKDSKTCTDAEGVTYHRGKKGYEHCVTSAAAKKNAEKDQMSGSAANDTTSDSGVKSDSGMSSDSKSSDSSSSDSMPSDSSVPRKE